ncbi:Chaperone for flagella basal body P-ring formation [Granulicella rosea]|uniref:Chaperone for flagella basal body P-ring formation n=1 Tax=Granulicella rosea TaxID=474952 RepID=A0A239H2M9_9BACT|nr:flagella basal body P-ring formation protein FlgA [Granulicella rosea]SNS75432.1 Chaperone for flagella basal body P-ring formation [Granulicella rosea]
MRRSLLALAACLALLAPAASALTAVCYPTPADAARQQTDGVTDLKSGYRVESRRFDPLLNRYWVMVRDCEHPERPAQTIASNDFAPLPAEGARSLVATKPVVVRAGSLVRVVSNSASVHLETPAYAIGNGGIGDRIRVRLVRLSTDTGQTAVELTATVRGPDYLELE